MTRVATSNADDVLIHTHSLADPNVELDLTADPWNLKDNQASVVIGRDVITPDTFGPDGGRKPLGPLPLPPPAFHELTGAFGVDFFGRKVVRFSDLFNTDDYEQRTSRSLVKLSAPQAWPPEMVNGLLFVNEDERIRDSNGSRRIKSITTTYQDNDTINWTVDFAIGRISDKFHILYGKNFDKRGIWVTSGRKFFLLQGGEYVQYMNLGPGTEGARWQMARVSRNMLMFVNDRHAARIIHLDEEPSVGFSDNSTLAGMITPVKPRDVEMPEILTNNSWLMKAVSGGGSINVSTKCRIRVRAVNVDDGGQNSPAASRFVQVFDEANPTDDFITVTDGDTVAIWNEPDDTDIATPPLHERWTHIEVWRTTAGGVDYFREQIIEIAQLANERHADLAGTNAPFAFTNARYLSTGGSGFAELVSDPPSSATNLFESYIHVVGDIAIITAPTTIGNWKTGSYKIAAKIDDNTLQLVSRISNPDPFNGSRAPVNGTIYRQADIFNFNGLVGEQFIACSLADADLTGFPVMNVEDVVAGGPPPMCRRVASLGGVTICMGKAGDDVVNPTADSRNFYAVDFVSMPGSKEIQNAGFFTNYTFQEGDRFVTTFDRHGSKIRLGEHEIDSRPTAHYIILKNSQAGHSSGATISGHIRRAYELDWPTIKSDEDVWYSRTDRFAPESFPVRSPTLTVSSIGDTFRTMVNVGNYVAVLMDSGVHLLFLSAGRLVKDTISATGQGTPWEDSVVVVSNSVLWASTEGPKAMTVSTEVASTGNRARIEIMGGTAIRQWFRDAFDEGDQIDAGLDALNHCVRWRRSKDANTYQVCQFSYRTGLWTLLEDDSGFAYAATTFAEADPNSVPVLYSVDTTGAVFEVNYQGKTHPYDRVAVQAVLDRKSVMLRGGDVFPTKVTTIFKSGAFLPSMLGDIVRFRSPNKDIDGLSRRITSAAHGWIGFDTVVGLNFGDEYIIGANRFRYRPAPLAGKFRSTVKTLEGVTVRALPGPRNNGKGNWPDPPQGKFTLRAFRDYDKVAVDTKDRELQIFDEDDVERTSDDRVSAVEGSGSALEVELEMIDARTDFRLELIEVQVREEVDPVTDVSETE